MIIYGTRLFGRCDEIEGVGHVATQFCHVYFCPLCPLGSFFVFNGDRFTNDTPMPMQMLCCCDDCCGSNTRRVATIPFHAWSAGLAYFQTFAIVVGIFALLNGAGLFSVNPILGIVFFLGGCLLITASYKAYQSGRYATFDQAKAIANSLGRRDILAKVHVLYGQQGKTNKRTGKQRHKGGEKNKRTGKQRHKGGKAGGLYNGVAKDETELERETFNDELTIDTDVPVADVLLVNDTTSTEIPVADALLVNDDVAPHIEATNDAPDVEMTTLKQMEA